MQINDEHRPYINSNSQMLANKKRLPNEPIFDRLHTDAVNKQKVQKRLQAINCEPSFEASDIASNSFNGLKSTQRKSRKLLASSHTARNRTPNNYGEKLYQKGLKTIEEK